MGDLIKNIALVEDDYFLMSAYSSAIQMAGYRVVTGDLLAMAQTQLHKRADAAIIDLSFEPSVAVPLIDALIDADIPVAVCSAKRHDFVPKRYQAVSFVEKTSDHQAVMLEAIEGLRKRARSTKAKAKAKPKP